MRVDLSPDLIKAVKKRLPTIDQKVYESFKKEEDFIDIAVRQLDNINCSEDGQSIRIQVKEMHQSPYVIYESPKFVRDKNPELADILYIVNYFKSGEVIERRASFAQAKFKKGKYDNWDDRRWEIPMHQFYLLDWMRDFEFVWKGANKTFTFEDHNKSFTTYIFASNFLPPFFQTVNRSKWYMYDLASDPTYYTLPRRSPWDVDEYSNRIVSLIDRKYGEAFSEGDMVFELVQYMFENQRESTFTKSRTRNDIIDESGEPLTDGGEPNNNHPKMLVVFVDIGLDTTIFSDTEFDQEAEIDGLMSLGRANLRNVE